MKKCALAIAALLLAGGALAATMTPQIGGGISQFDGGIVKSGTVSGGGGGTNFRVTNTGDTRVTSTGDSRVISP